MSPVKRHLTPVDKEYFQPPNRSVYKVYSRYKISTVTLHDFGLEIDQRKGKLPLVWSNDNMSINTPSNNENVDVKPFCCTHCGSGFSK